MRKRISLFALIFVALTTNFTLAQNTEKSSVRRVKGQVLSSDNLPPLRVKFKKTFKFVGSQSFVLYEKAQVEQFFFVEADERGQIKRMYMTQFEGSLPNAGATYNYPVTQTVTLGKEIYVVNAEVISNVSAALKQNPQSDVARAGTTITDRSFNSIRSHSLLIFEGKEPPPIRTRDFSFARFYFSVMDGRVV